MYVQNTQKKQRKNRGKTRITPIHSESECLRQAGSVGGGLVREALTDYPRQTTNLNQGHTNYHDSSFCAWPSNKNIGRGLFADTLEYTRRKNMKERKRVTRFGLETSSRDDSTRRRTRRRRRRRKRGTTAYTELARTALFSLLFLAPFLCGYQGGAT